MFGFKIIFVSMLRSQLRMFKIDNYIMHRILMDYYTMIQLNNNSEEPISHYNYETSGFANS